MPYQNVTDFSIPHATYGTDEVLRPVSPEQTTRLRDVVEHLGNLAARGDEQDTLITIGGIICVQLLPEHRSFGVFNYVPGPDSLDRHTPLVLAGKYLRMPPEARGIPPYIAGQGSQAVSGRSIDFLSATIEMEMEYLPHQPVYTSRDTIPT